MSDVNEENAFPYEKTLLNTIVKNAKETKVIKYFKFKIYITYILVKNILVLI